MIVRINQFDVVRCEDESGWPNEGRLGPLAAPWPAGANAFEILILEHDEQHRPMLESFRQQQLRQLIPHAVAALQEPGEQIVVRLDGALGARELLPAYQHLTDPDGRGRFAVSAAAKFELPPGETLASVRSQKTVQSLQALCSDAALGLERSVRLRAFSVAEEIINVLLDIDLPEDARWASVLEGAGLVLSTTGGMRALHVITTRFNASAVKSRLMQRLTSLAQNSG
jgi:hypothetical protein